ncbi:TRAP transporter substrate-binding protein [uncultured Maricaulis sp.]|uniref:TRAP transporter substrate-binding protein n=1 Tax=uncultured Maricaulis sp. TaxID=174710 RepID=UPI00260A55D6|nr:TRAP transporter substrate-binding protein [uncultured Maricaulis sp.]
MINRRHLIATGAAAAVAGCGQADRPLYSADAHVADYPTVQGVQAMARMVEERTGGRQRVKIFAGAQLGSERDTLELTVFGALDLNRINLAPLNSVANETIVPSLPFLFNSIEHMRTSLDGAPGQTILDALRPHGLVGLCFYDSGARSFYNTSHPIHTPDDLRGMKIRVQNSDLYVAMVEALGANPTPMAFGEVYQSLVQGVIDGAENNWPSYETTRHFEAARYYSLSRHVMAPEILVMSKHRWDRLSAEDQAIFQQAARDSVPVMRELWDARVADSRERVLAGGVEANEIADIGAFSDRMESVWDRFVVSDVQRRLVEDIRNLGGQV